MVDRRLILSVEGAPVCYGAFAGDIRAKILEYSDDFADLFQVWSVPSSEQSLVTPAEEITERFAVEWSKEFEFADADSSIDATRNFPAFVREAAHMHLLEAWTVARGEARVA